MSEQIIPIPPPQKGLIEGWSFSEQPEGSARQFQNLRLQDCTNGRMRMSQRAGLSKYCAASLDTPGTKAVGLVSFFVDNRQVTYAAAASGSEVETWDEATPGNGACRNVKIDRQGNRYALSGNSGVVKFSADGEQVWQLAVPVADTNHVIRALCVTDADLVIVGVSEGGEQKTAKLFCFEQLPDNKTQKLWEIETKAYVEDCLVSQGKLYTCQNRTDRKKSLVRIYEFITGPNPELAKEWRCPHPVNSIAVKKDGAVLVACEATAGGPEGLFWRDPDPKYPESFPDSVDWDPLQNLTEKDRRIWAALRGDSLDDTDVVSDLQEGVEVYRWRDSTDNLRHTIAPYDDAQSDTGPALAMDAWLEHRAVRFTQPNNLLAPQQPPFQALRSGPNASTAKTFADQQRTLIPGYRDSAFAIYVVCRPSQTEQTGASVDSRWLLGQDRDNADSGSDDHILFVNTSSAGGDALPPTASSGRVYWFTGEGALANGDGTGGTIREGRFDVRNNNGTNPDGSTTNLGNVAIISMIYDGAVTTAKSLFSINGDPIDAFSSRGQSPTSGQETLRPTYLGIFRARLTADTNPSAGVEGFLGDVLEILVLDRRNRNEASSNVVSFDNLQFNSLAASQTINEHTLITGYLAHKYGIQASLAYSNAAVNNYPHPFGITGTGQDRLAGPPNQAGSAVSTVQALANKAWASVVKYSPEGKIVWCANEMELVSGNRTGGFGYAVAVNSDGNIYSVGPAPTGTGSDDDAQVRLIIDQGTDFSLQVADGAWSAVYPSNFNQTYHYPRIDVDEFDNLYLPFPASAGTVAGFRVYQKTGTLLHSGVTGAETESYAVAADRRIPDYRTDITPKRAEFIVVGTNQTASGAANVHNVRLVNSTQASGSPRTLWTLGVSGGDIVRFQTSGVTSPTGGAAALDSTARYVQATTLFKKAYWTDGKVYRVFEPVTNAVTQLKAKTGSLPSKCALIEQWRGRLFFARSADEPHNWFCAAKDDPTNFDYFPPVPSETQAVAGNASTAGLCPDIINSIVPYDEDVLLLGGDHSIWAMDGDPAAGGRLVLVSDITGMSFGRPWCKDPNGVLYFVGSRGGLFRWVPGAKPDRISTLRIERALQDIDFGSYHVKLAWNYQDEGIHILVCPFGAGGEAVAHYFFEAKPDAFAKDVFGTATHTNVQPTDVLVIDGDEFADRVLVFGCEDGFIRKWDSAARSDDTQTDGSTKIPIDSFVTLFPLPGIEEGSGLETQFQGLTVVLGDRDSGCRYELFASDEPDSFGVAVAQGVLGPGRNPPQWRRVVGAYCGLRLRNAAAEERWSMERAYIHVSPAGMARPRLVN